MCNLISYTSMMVTYYAWEEKYIIEKKKYSLLLFFYSLSSISKYIACIKKGDTSIYFTHNDQEEYLIFYAFFGFYLLTTEP